MPHFLVPVLWLIDPYIMYPSCKTKASFCVLPHRSYVLHRLPSFELDLLKKWLKVLQMHLWYVICHYLFIQISKDEKSWPFILMFHRTDLAKRTSH